jgi:cellulase
MLALHSSQTLGGAQFYIGCVQLKVTGTGSGTCGPSISIPGAYKESDENIFIPKYYNGFDATTYKAPGGPVGSCGGASGAEPATPTKSAAASASASASVVAKVTATPTPVASSAPAASSTPAPVESSAPVASSSPVASPSPVASSAPAPAPSSGAGSDLPKEFTIKTFIAWLEGKAGNASRARRHARAF